MWYEHSSVLPWLAILAMVAANALYVAAEFSAVAAQRVQIAQLAEAGNRRAATLLAILEDGTRLDRYIAACQIGITLSSLVAGAYAQATIGFDLAPLLARWFELSAEAAISTAAIVVLLALTGLQVVLGELVPKSLALQYPERTALVTLVPTRWSATVFRGFIWLLNGSGFLLLRPFGIKPGGHQHVHSPDEIKLLIAESTRGGTVSTETSKRLERGLQLSERLIRDIMIARDRIYALERSSPPDEIVRAAHESPYSRIVIYERTLEHVVGSVSVKDIVAHYAEQGEVPALDSVTRPIPSVRDTEPALRLVRLLQDQKSSKAIVAGEDGKVIGFVSVADVLAEVFGAEAAA